MAGGGEGRMEPKKSTTKRKWASCDTFTLYWSIKKVRNKIKMRKAAELTSPRDKETVHNYSVDAPTLLYIQRRRLGAYIYMECTASESMGTNFLVACAPSKQTQIARTL
jgi:hypothetical protein